MYVCTFFFFVAVVFSIVDTVNINVAVVVFLFIYLYLFFKKKSSRVVGEVALTVRFLANIKDTKLYILRTWFHADCQLHGTALSRHLSIAGNSPSFVAQLLYDSSLIWRRLVR